VEKEATVQKRKERKAGIALASLEDWTLKMSVASNAVRHGLRLAHYAPAWSMGHDISQSVLPYRK